MTSAPTPTPTPQDFCDRAEFRMWRGQLQARLDGVIYKVESFGDDAVQVQTLDGTPMATLTIVNGKFVPAGWGEEGN